MTQVRPVIATKRPAKVEAMKWDGTNTDELVSWVNRTSAHQTAQLHPHEDFITLGDNVDTVKPGNWVIRDQFNDFYPLPTEVFHAVYEAPIL